MLSFSMIQMDFNLLKSLIKFYRISMNLLLWLFLPLCSGERAKLGFQGSIIVMSIPPNNFPLLFGRKTCSGWDFIRSAFPLFCTISFSLDYSKKLNPFTKFVPLRWYIVCSYFFCGRTLYFFSIKKHRREIDLRHSFPRRIFGWNFHPHFPSVSKDWKETPSMCTYHWWSGVQIFTLFLKDSSRI